MAGGSGKSAPFSTHARGVPLFDKNSFSDAQKELTAILLDLRDIGSSIFWFLSLQSWLTLWSVIINIVSGRYCVVGVLSCLSCLANALTEGQVYMELYNAL